MTTLHLHPPLIITSRLLPGVRIGDGTDHAGTVSLDPSAGWVYHIDLDDGTTVTGDDFSPPAVRYDSPDEAVRDAMGCLLSFLGAFAEARHPRFHDATFTPECWNLFPDELAEWAYLNDDEIAMTQYDLENEDEEDDQ